MSFETIGYAVLAIIFAIGAVVAYQVTQEGLFGVVGALFSGASLLKALKFNMG